MNTETKSAEIVKSGEAPSSLSKMEMSRNGIQINSMDDLFRFSKAVVCAGLAPKNLEKPESVFVAIQMGMELGISPMAALQNIGVINGKPKIYGPMPLALVRSSGLLEFIKESIEGTGDNRVAVCITKRRGDADPKKTTFSVSDAKEAGLWKKQGPWSQYPERMMMYRSRGFNLDDNFPDVLKGMASHDGAIDLPSQSVTVESAPSKSLPEGTQQAAAASPAAAPKLEGYRASKAFQKMYEAFLGGNWKTIEVHFEGEKHKTKGKTLEDLEKNDPQAFHFLRRMWEPQLLKGSYSAEDLTLRSALDAAQKDRDVQLENQEKAGIGAAPESNQ